MSVKIFISCRADAEGYAARIRARLKGFDFSDNSRIVHGETFSQDIDKAVGECDLLFVLIGRNWLGGLEPGKRLVEHPNDFVRLEIAAALKRGIPVIPILLAGAVMPTAEELPADIARFAGNKALEVTDQDFDRELKLLVGVASLKVAVASLNSAQMNLSSFPSMTSEELARLQAFTNALFQRAKTKSEKREPVLLGASAPQTVRAGDKFTCPGWEPGATLRRCCRMRFGTRWAEPHMLS